LYQEPTVTLGSASTPKEALPADPVPVDDPVELPLIAVAHARSGDKGADANIGVRARHPDFLPLLKDQVSVDVVADRFSHRIEGPVQRYELPGIDALNFVLRNALGGGGTASLRFDPQGKAYAQQLLDMPIQVPTAWLSHPATAEVAEVQAARKKRGLSPFWKG
jgi:hypothetical protein